MSILPIYLINIHYFTIFNYFLHPSHFSLLLKSSHTQPMPPSTINPPSSSTATANRAPSSATNQNPDHQAPSMIKQRIKTIKTPKIIKTFKNHQKPRSRT